MKRNYIINHDNTIDEKSKEFLLKYVDYINDIEDINELRKEFEDLWIDYHELNISYTKAISELAVNGLLVK